MSEWVIYAVSSRTSTLADDRHGQVVLGGTPWSVLAVVVQGLCICKDRIEGKSMLQSADVVRAAHCFSNVPNQAMEGDVTSTRRFKSKGEPIFKVKN